MNSDRRGKFWFDLIRTRYIFVTASDDGRSEISNLLTPAGFTELCTSSKSAGVLHVLNIIFVKLGGLRGGEETIFMFPLKVGNFHAIRSKFSESGLSALC